MTVGRVRQRRPVGRPDRVALAPHVRRDRTRRPARSARCAIHGVATVRTTIAVVNVVGPIVSGRGDRTLLPLGESSAGGDTIAAALRTAAATDGVAAIVLRARNRHYRSVFELETADADHDGVPDVYAAAPQRGGNPA